MITTLEDARLMLKPRNPLGHKGTFGHGLLIAGCHGMAGAAILAAKAALRSGVGKLTVCSPECNRIILQTNVPEAIVCTSLPADLSAYDAVAIGPGIGRSADAKQMVLDVISGMPDRLIVDADGLNNIADCDGQKRMSLLCHTVITPHLGEWKRLIREEASMVSEADAIVRARQIAEFANLYIVLKAGRYIAGKDMRKQVANASIFTPEGSEYQNTTGNSGMATAGSGDVLTGIILSLLAQGYDAECACRLGVWLHGKAGDFAAQNIGQHSMLASDIIAHLSDAFKSIM